MTTPHEAPAVALTEEHLKTLHSLSETLHRRSMTSAAKRIQEVAANIRSQVQGGMVLVRRSEIEALEMDRRMLTVWKTYNPAPGTIAKHAIVTDTCRANRTDEGAAREAADRLVAEFLECAPSWKSMGARFHFTLTLQRPSGGATGIRTTAEQAAHWLTPQQESK